MQSRMNMANPLGFSRAPGSGERSGPLAVACADSGSIPAIVRRVTKAE